MKKILFGSLIIIALSITLVFANANIRPYRLINADFLNIDMINNEYVTRLTGNVNFFYGETEFYADEADIYELQRLVKMTGNVEVYEDSLSLFAHQAEYYRDIEELILDRNVFVREEHQDGTVRTFASDSARYHREEQKIYSFRNSVLNDQRESIIVTSDYLDYDLNSGYGYITGEPVISFVREDTLIVAAEKIEFYRDFNRIAASFDVITTYNDIAVYSDFLLYFLEEDYAVFLGHPSLSSESAEAQAERFYVYFDDNKINRATLERDCRIDFAVKQEGAKDSSIKADLIELSFSDGKISAIEAFDNVRSLYVGDDGKELAINNADSDRLKIFFSEENEIDTIVFTGKVKGTYMFSEKGFDDSELPD